MRNKIVLIALITGLHAATFAQTDTVRIHTSAVCDECKKTLEHNLNFEKGIKSSNLKVDDGVLTVIYNPLKTDVQRIRKAVTLSGYDADSLAADPKAYKKLSDCCKKNGDHAKH